MADKATVKNAMRGLLDPLAAALERAGATPLAVTVAGLLMSLAGAVFVARGRMRTGAFVLLAGGLCDVLDGSLARRTGTESAFGAFIDSTIDRVTEIAIFGALVVHFAGAGAGPLLRLEALASGAAAPDPRIALLLVALAGSFLTSYTRARAEGLGLECRVGLIERPERVGIIVAGLLAGGVVLDAAILALAILTAATAAQRIVHVRRLTTGRGLPR